MKKCIFFVLFALVAVSAVAQEAIALGGYGYSQKSSTNKGEYGFAEARIMFKLKGNFRGGPYGAYVGYGNVVTGKSVFKGREWKYGLSLDSYGALAYSYSYYAWINSGIKNVTDQYHESSYQSKTLTNEIFISGGLSITDDWQGWFGHNQIMFDYQKPIGTPKITATWKGKAISDKPYNKESYRITLESGVKRFGKTLNVEPILHLGYGKDFGRDQNYYEYGGGLGLGVYRDWYREILKISVFKRNDFNDINNNSQNKMNVEINFNATSLYRLLVKNK
jgi:hypothetical protein